MSHIRAGMRRLRLVLVAGLALLTLSGAAAAGGYPNTKIIAALNAERTANGLPSVTENPDWSAKCKLHDDFEIANNVFAHEEDPTLPGYSDAGNWAGTNSILSEGDSWADGDVFATAPLHLIQLMAPYLTRTGVDERDDRVCMTTWPGYDYSRFAGQPQVFTYPGNGVIDVPYAEQAVEMPFVPGDFVGLRQGTTTGFNIMAWAVGLDPWSTHLTAASLTGPDGQPVKIETVDRTTATVGPYLPPGGAFLIPDKPLSQGTTYTASVTYADDRGRSVSHTWTFTTGERAVEGAGRSGKPAVGKAVRSGRPAVRKLGRSGLTVVVQANRATEAIVRLTKVSGKRRSLPRSARVHVAAGVRRIDLRQLFPRLAKGRYRVFVVAATRTLGPYPITVG